MGNLNHLCLLWGQRTYSCSSGTSISQNNIDYIKFLFKGKKRRKKKRKKTIKQEKKEKNLKKEEKEVNFHMSRLNNENKQLP